MILQLSATYRDIPSSIRITAIEKIALYDRTTEELERMKEDIKTAVHHHYNLFTVVMETAVSKSGGARALITERASVLSILLNTLLGFAEQYVTNLPTCRVEVSSKTEHVYGGDIFLDSEDMLSDYEPASDDSSSDELE